MINAMPYYYLNDKKEPQGPHTEAELRELLRSGILTEQTLTAATGDSHWRPLKEILGDDSGCPPVPEPVLECPTCQSKLELEGAELPERCPHCGRALRPGKRGIWANFWLALRQYAKFSGRATRAEYWSYILGLYLILIGMVLLVLMLVAVLASCGVGAAACAFICLGLLVLFGLAVVVPSLAVMVRRLHDVGFSGKWLLLSYVVSFAATGLIFWSMWSVAQADVERYIEDIELVEQENRATNEWGWPMAPLPYREVSDEDWEEEEEADDESGNAQGAWELFAAEFRHSYQEQREMRESINSTGLGSAGLLLDLLGRLLGLFLFVLTLLDSKRGSNQYGPSRKYPLG